MKKRALLISLLLLAAGCGGYHSKKPSSAAAGSGVTKTITVSEKEFSITPNTIDVSGPGTYVIKGMNKGTTKHALAVEGHGVDEDSTPVSPGQTTTLKVTIKKAGTYELYCPVDHHEDMGMKGSLVAGGSGGAAPQKPATTTNGGGGGGY